MKTWLLSVVAMVTGALGLLAGMGLSLEVERMGRAAVHASDTRFAIGEQLSRVTPEIPGVAAVSPETMREHALIDEAVLKLVTSPDDLATRVSYVCRCTALRLSRTLPGGRWQVDGYVQDVAKDKPCARVYAHVNAAGVSQVDVVVADDSIGPMPRSLPLLSPADPAVQPRRAFDASVPQLTNASESSRSSAAAEQLAQLAVVETQRKRSKIRLPEVDGHDWAFAAAMRGR